ncbi:MAG TPA: CHAP domain-containing protein [Candidatus Dormibacteraeota bacterium]
MIVAAVLSPPAQRDVRADGFDQQISALQGQADGLTQQISTAQQESSAASTQAATVAQELAQTQAQTVAAQNVLDAANLRLAATTASLVATEAQLVNDRKQLGQLVVMMYQIRSNGTVTRALVDSQSFAQTMSTIESVAQVSDHMKSLVQDVQSREQRLTVLRQQQQTEQQQAAQAVASLQSLAAQQSAEQQEFQAEAGSLSGQAASLAAQLQGVVSHIGQVRAAQAAARAASIGAARILSGAIPPFANGARADYFPWGQCTWYVASLRDVTWNGDAWQWAGTAADQGMPEGMQPRVGAIVVFARGGAYSQLGHVAYVDAVNSATSFTVDEANFVGLGVVDRRYVPSLAGIEAFIY